mgnify:CR=1 FL=1
MQDTNARSRDDRPQAQEPVQRRKLERGIPAAREAAAAVPTRPGGATAGMVTVTVYNSNGTTASIGFRYNDTKPASPEPWDPLTGYPWQ